MSNHFISLQKTEQIKSNQRKISVCLNVWHLSESTVSKGFISEILMTIYRSCSTVPQKDRMNRDEIILWKNIIVITVNTILKKDTGTTDRWRYQKVVVMTVHLKTAHDPVRTDTSTNTWGVTKETDSKEMILQNNMIIMLYSRQYIFNCLMWWTLIQ